MARAPAPSHHIFEISRGSGSRPIQQSLVAALVFCCLAVLLQTGSFLTGHNGAPQKIVKRQKHCTCFILIETCTRLVGSIGPGGGRLYLTPSFSRETPCQNVINFKQARAAEELLLGDPHGASRIPGSLYWTCHGRVSSVRSKSNVLLAYISNFLPVFFILVRALFSVAQLESGVSFHIPRTRTQLHM